MSHYSIRGISLSAINLFALAALSACGSSPRVPDMPESQKQMTSEPGVPEDWVVYVKKHSRMQYGPGNWQFGCSGNAFKEEFVVKNGQVIFVMDGKQYSSPLSTSRSFNIGIPLKERAVTNSYSDSTITRDKRTLIFKGSLNTGNGRFTVGVEEFDNQGCTAKAYYRKVV